MLSLLLFVFLAHPSLSCAELVSTGVGLVRGEVVTSREVQIQNLLNVALSDKKPQSKLRLLPLDSKAFSQATADTLLEMVVALEAQNFNVVQISPDDVKKAQSQALKILKNAAPWKSLQVSTVELEAALHRKVQAKKFVEFRSQSSVLPVTDAEAERYFNENKLKYDNLPFENFKENIKTLLTREQVEKRMKDWFDVLLSKYQVKNLIAEI